MQKPLPALCIIVLLSISFTYQTASQAVFDSTLIHSSTTVYFDTDQSTLRHEYKHNLIHLADTVHYLKNYAFRLVGHTDEKGSDAYNMKLSERRAMEIRNQLISLGIPDSVIHFEYRGERDPAAEGSDLTSDSLNRRVTVNLFHDQKFVSLTGQLLDDYDDPVQNAEVQILAPGWKHESRTDTSGSFDILAPAWKDITIQAFAPGYFYKSQHFNRKELLESPVLPLAIPKIEIDRVFALENVHFYGNLAIPLPKSLDEIHALYKTMKINQDLCVEIGGHMNLPLKPDVSRNSAHFMLSIARARTINDTLVSRGIDSVRLHVKGYGNWKMIYPKATLESQQAKNRRVEITVKDCFALKNLESDDLPPSERRAFNFIPSRKKFNPFSFQSDLLLFSPGDREKILEQLKLLKSKKLNPFKYTYEQLLQGDTIPKSILNSDFYGD